jgi:hypothetical protein
MEKFEKLSRGEMKDVIGGVIGGGCITSECSNDDGCKGSKYGGTCVISTCVATGDPANYCTNNPFD